MKEEKTSVFNASRPLGWTVFLLGIFYLVSVKPIIIDQFQLTNPFVLWFSAMLPLALLYRSHSLIMEFTMVLFIWWSFDRSAHNDAVWYWLLTAPVIISLGHALQTRLSAATAAAATAVSLDIPGMIDSGMPGWLDILVILIIMFSLVVLLRGYFGRASPAPRKVDVILSSYSSNTAHFTYKFIDGLRRAGAEATVHRLHYHKRFKPELSGDSLVAAFPVFGWKPPRPLLHWLLKELPRGRGRPAFILYTAAGGPENAAFLPWLILMLKGWRVKGRLWSIYPLNVATFRLGPKKLWKKLDRCCPSRADVEKAVFSGRQFGMGKNTGFPLIVWPFPLIFFGILLENRWLNTFLYRNYAWKRRCVSCSRCIRYCPEERLFLKNGYPRARGTCILCLGCINVCPVNAMHLLFWTEYGQPYKPRWPRYLVRGDESDLPINQ